MTIASNLSKQVFSADGVQTEFPVSFRFSAPEHLAVYGASGEQYQIGTDYTVSGDSYGKFDNGGTVIFIQPPPAGTLAILRQTPLTQESDYVPNGNIRAETLEKDLDKSVMIAQEIMEILSRCLKVAPTESDPDIYWTMINAIKDACALSAANSATSAATAGTIAASIGHIWTELTGDESLFDAAFATAQDLMEAKGAVDAAAAAAVAGVNDATLAALNAANTEIEEAKDSSLVALDTALGNSTGSLTLLVAEATGAKTAAEAAQAAAEASTGDAATSATTAANSATSAAASAVTSGNSAASAAAAQSVAEDAAVAAVNAADDADDRAAIASANSAVALSQAQAAAAAKVAAQEAQTAAEAAAAAAVIDVDNAVAIHNGAATAHQTLFNAKAPLASPALTGTPTAPTATAGTNTTQIATTAFVTGAVTGKANANLDNLSLAAALTNLGFLGSLTQNGYQKLPGGLIVQWGLSTYDSGSLTERSVVFPVAFPNGAWIVTGTDVGLLSYCYSFSSYSATGFMAHFADGLGEWGFNWIAIGY
mgnify:CR=1 FL=1